MAKKNHEGEILTRKVFNEGFCWGWNFHFWGGAWPALIETSTVIARLASDCHKHPAEASQDKWVSVAFTFITFLPAPGNKWSTIRKNISLRIFFFFFFCASDRNRNWYRAAAWVDIFVQIGGWYIYILPCSQPRGSNVWSEVSSDLGKALPGSEK